MFVPKIQGRSMEPGVPAGSWGLFRAFAGAAGAASLDGRRVIVELRDDGDPETGGKYTLKRWRSLADGRVALAPDNPDFAVLTLRSERIRAVAELLAVVG